jgi:hypothetical protein
MHAKLNSRLKELEEIAQRQRKQIIKMILAEAFRALSREESEAITSVFKRLVQGNSMGEALAKCTPAEASAVERFNAASVAAALRITGRPLSNEQAGDVIIRSTDDRLSEPWRYQWLT